MKDRNKLRKLKAKRLEKSANTKKKNKEKENINKEKRRKRKLHKNELKTVREIRKIPLCRNIVQLASHAVGLSAAGRTWF